MILAEVFDKEHGDFICLLQCRTMQEFEYLTSIIAFQIDIEIEVINYCEEVTLQ